LLGCGDRGREKGCCGAGPVREGGGAAGGGKRRGTSRLAGWARKQNGPDKDRG
jgi:hypothetical protein